MERESFEDAQVAALMNRDFVCIKVDREERPDLDEIYMRAVLARLDPGAESPHLPWMKGRSQGLEVPTAFVCEGFACRLPVTSEEDLAAQLDAFP